MKSDTKSKTPLLDELEQGPWPSFVTEIKKTATANPACEDLLGQLELSYEEKKGHWKHGGLVGVLVSYVHGFDAMPRHTSSGMIPGALRLL